LRGIEVDEYAGRQSVGIDVHRRRSVIVRMTPDEQRIGAVVRIEVERFWRLSDLRPD
jgi:hypothetical protein